MNMRLIGCILVVAVTGCAGDGDTDGGTAASTSIDSAAGASPGAAHDATAAGASDAHGAAAGEGLALLPIMRQLGVDMMAPTQALVTDDYATLTARAGAIAEHPPVSQPELQRIQSVLGEEMHGFEELDMAVHKSSVLLHQAAEARDIDVVLTRLGEVQRGCVACHQQFRERLRTTTSTQ